MRIVQVITRRELRGAEVVARDVCCGLSRRGHQVMLVGLFEPPDRRQADELSGQLGRVVDLGGAKRRGFSFSIARSLRRELARFAPDVVQANAFNALKFAAAVKLWTRAGWPLVYRNVGLASQWITRPGQRGWGWFLLRQVDCVLSVSAASRDDFVTTYGFPRSRIEVTQQGVPIPTEAERQAARQALRLLAGNRQSSGQPSPLLIHVGSFTPEKNHRGLLEAYSLIRDHHAGAHLVLVGDGPLQEEIRRLVQSKQLQRYVHFLGARADAARLAAGADLLLMSSHVEGIPGVVLEASAGAVPVVATGVGGLREIVQDGATGRLTPAGDMAALAAAACQLLADRPLRIRLGEAARRLVVQRHDFEKSLDQVERVYESLCPGKGV